MLVGCKAPDFTAPVVMPSGEIVDDFNLMKEIEGQYALLFFYPLDFTFVCPSEIIAYNNRLGEFSERNTKVIGISVDSQFTHLAWKNTDVNKGGIGNVQMPLVSDLSKNIARDYDVLHNGSVALRATFVIDKQGIIRNAVINDLPIGRCVDDALRVIDALDFHNEHGQVCPAGWQKGQDGMTATADGVADYLASNADKL